MSLAGRRSPTSAGSGPTSASTPSDHYGHKNVILREPGGRGDPGPADPGRGPDRLAMRGENFAAALACWARWRSCPSTGDSRIARPSPRYFAECDEQPSTPATTASPSAELPLEGCMEQARRRRPICSASWRSGTRTRLVVIPARHHLGLLHASRAPPGTSSSTAPCTTPSATSRCSRCTRATATRRSIVSFRAVEFDAAGNPSCPEPRARLSSRAAGAPARSSASRCLAEGEAAGECEGRAEDARANARGRGRRGRRTCTVPGEATGADFLDAGQCRDCRRARLQLPPGRVGAVHPRARQLRRGRRGRSRGASGWASWRRATITSRDRARATRRYARRGNTESNTRRPRSPDGARRLLPRFASGARGAESPGSVPCRDSSALSGFDARSRPSGRPPSSRPAASSRSTAEGRDRELDLAGASQRQARSTARAGPRILLWFDLLNPPGSRGLKAPMGSEVEMGERADLPGARGRLLRAASGLPGLRARVARARTRLAHLCKGECYNPSDDTRRPIARGSRSSACVRRPEPGRGRGGADRRPLAHVRRATGDPAGCVVTFSDPGVRAYSRRDTVYYARAFEAPKPRPSTPATCAAERDEAGRCLAVAPLPGPGRPRRRLPSRPTSRAPGAPPSSWTSRDPPRRRASGRSRGPSCDSIRPVPIREGEVCSAIWSSVSSFSSWAGCCSCAARGAEPSATTRSPGSPWPWRARAPRWTPAARRRPSPPIRWAPRTRSRSCSATSTSTPPSPSTPSCSACRSWAGRAPTRRPTPATTRVGAPSSTSGRSTTTPRT